MVVGLALLMPQRERHAADLKRQLVAVGAVWVAVPGGPAQARHAELAAVDDLVVSSGHHVPVEPLRHSLMRYHYRRRPAVLLGLGLPDRDTEDMVDMPVRVDRGVQPLAGSSAAAHRGCSAQPASSRYRPGPALRRSSPPSHSAKAGTNAIPSPISASPPKWPTGCSSRVSTSPRHSRSASVSTSSAIVTPPLPHRCMAGDPRTPSARSQRGTRQRTQLMMTPPAGAATKKPIAKSNPAGHQGHQARCTAPSIGRTRPTPAAPTQLSLA